jgi:uncharacterized membrane protein YecN with MAPEG domain
MTLPISTHFRGGGSADPHLAEPPGQPASAATTGSRSATATIQAVRTRMRSHANFAENTPIFLILLALVEMARGSATWLWVAAILYILARIAHAFGMDRPAPNAGCAVIGVVLSWLVLLVPRQLRALCRQRIPAGFCLHCR